MILQSVWNHPVTQGRMTEDLNVCRNPKVCTVVSVWYWSSVKFIFQFYRCLKSMYVALLEVICVCLLGHYLYVVFQDGIKKCRTYAKSDILFLDSLFQVTMRMCIHFMLMCWYITQLCLSDTQMHTFMSSSPGNNWISTLWIRLFVYTFNPLKNRVKSYL